MNERAMTSPTDLRKLADEAQDIVCPVHCWDALREAADELESARKFVAASLAYLEGPLTETTEWCEALRNHRAAYPAKEDSP